MKINDGFVLREIVGEQVIMPAGENITKFDGAVVLNDVSAFIYNTIEANPGIEVDALAEKITEEYDVDLETAKKDLVEVLGELRSYGIVS